MRTCTSSFDSMNSARLLPAWRAATLGWHSMLRRTGQSRSRHQIGDGGLGIHHRHIHVARRRARPRRGSPGRFPLRRPRGGNRAGWARRDARRSSAASAPAACACVVAPSLRMSSSAYSSRSKDFMTAGSRCWPALVSTSACGLALEQLHADQFLERDHVARQGALRDQQRIGGGGEARVLGDAFEGAQRVQAAASGGR